MLFHQIGCICCLLHGLVLECSLEEGLLFERFSKTLWSGDQLNSFGKWCHGVPALVLRAPELSSNNGAVEHQPRHSVPKWWYNNGAPANQQWRWAPKMAALTLKPDVVGGRLVSTVTATERYTLYIRRSTNTNRKTDMIRIKIWIKV